jgi:anti-sigma factor RsiW
MADCAEMQTLILQAVDDRLDPAGREALSAHVAQCDGCRRTLAAQQAVKQALAGLPLLSVSGDFASRVRERVSARWIDVFNWRGWTLRLAPVAVLLALLAVLPVPGRSVSETAASDTAQSPSGVLDTWTASRAGAAQETAAGGDTTTSPMQLLLNPDADPHALLAAALEETGR